MYYNTLMTDIPRESDQTIELSKTTRQLLTTLRDIETTREPAKGDVIEVSDAASFFAFMYEKVRNSVEFGEEHLFRRMAIYRNLRRRLSVNPTGEHEGENSIRELLWGSYFSKGTLTETDAILTQSIIDAYLQLKNTILRGVSSRGQGKLIDSLYELCSCEIEEMLTKKETDKRLSYLYYFYQTTKERVSIEGVDTEKRDQYYYVACEQAFLKNDSAFVRYHLFTLQYGRLVEAPEEERLRIAAEYRETVRSFESILINPYAEKLSRFVRAQVPPFRILETILKQMPKQMGQIADREVLLKHVQDVCEIKYAETAQKLRTAGIRSIIYIFATKMIFVLLVEIPLSLYIYNQLEGLSLGINTLFPPVLMGLIVTFVSPPSQQNTQKLYNRIVDIIDEESNYETSVGVTLTKQKRDRRPILTAVFSTVYTVLTFGVFIAIYLILHRLHFTIISTGIFMFFISVVTFFGYRIRQIAKEYVVDAQGNALSPIIETIFLPVLRVGKILSSQLSKINVLLFVFDVLIEAPFKLIVEILEEWMRFAKARKEEII